MSTPSLPHRTGAATMAPASYARFAGACAILAGGTGFLYAVAFIALRNDLLSALFLLLGGLFATAALVGVYDRLRPTDASFALLAILVSVAGALGATIHGGYDLANTLHPPPTVPDLPQALDPRGLLTFGRAGLGVFIIAWLMGRDPGTRFPSGLRPLGYGLAVLLVALYLSRLFILDAKNPLVVVLAVVSGLLADPAWYISSGWAARCGVSRMPQAEQPPTLIRKRPKRPALPDAARPAGLHV